MAVVDTAVSALRRAERDIEGQLAGVRQAIASLTRAAGRGGRGAGRLAAGAMAPKRRKLSADARARISAAQKRRWAKHKASENKK